MIIFLYGSDDYRREARRRFYVAEYKKKHSNLGIEVFDFLEDGQFEKFQSFITNRSIFDSFKMAVLTHFFEGASKELIAEVKSLALGGKETTILISENKTPTKESNFLLKKPTLAEEFAPFEGAEWIAFIRDEAKRRGLTLSAPALAFLGEAYRGDSWRVATELEKLSFLDKKTIEVKDLEYMDLELTPNFWLLLNGLKHSDWRRRLECLERLFAENEPSAKIFNILSSQWTEKLRAMADYDVMIKSGKLEYEEVLLDAVL